MTLKNLKSGECGLIKKVGGKGNLRQHLLDMGIIPGTKITVQKFAPMGDPVQIKIRGYELTLRLEDAGHIEVEKTDEEIPLEKGKKLFKTFHPNIGEPGIHHHDSNSKPYGKDHVLTFALVGNQNCGKTTLFNRLTGSNQHVGNFPGVTVDKKDGQILNYPGTRITDLPGIYSMSAYSSEELVSRNFVLEEKPDAIINIVDATNIERNLYLTMQLLKMDRPLVVALNMMDELTGNGGSIDVNKMEELLGVPVVPISAARNSGIEELVEHAVHIAMYQEKPEPRDFCSQDDNGGQVHRCLHAVRHLIEDHALSSGIPLNFAATKVIEGDSHIIDRLNLDLNERETLEHITVQMEEERKLDRSAAIADMRFAFIEKVCSESVVKPQKSREQERSRKIDTILTGKYTAIPVFAAIMAGVFYLTFNFFGAFLQNLFEDGIETVTEYADHFLTKVNVNETVHSLVIDGIFNGVGSVLSFLPVVVVMFFFLSMLEDSGYIARVAFVMDKLLRKIGLSGRSIVPLLIGFGCTVPAVMSTRTLPSDRDRKMTVLLTPFMSCTAKLPVYAFFVNAFFKEHAGLVMTGIYFTGILAGIIVSFLYKKLLFKGEAVPFVMELPNYRIPGLNNTMQLMWEKAKDFLTRAFTVIFLATIVVWFFESFDFHFNLVEDSSESMLAWVAGKIAPLFSPLGFGSWQVVTGLISGVMAKESVVSVLEVLFGQGNDLNTVLTTASAGALIVFSALYTPCIAAIAAIKRESGTRWAFGVVIWQCVVAWLCAFGIKFLIELF